MLIYALAPGHEEFGGRTVHETQVITVRNSYTMNWLSNDIKNRIDTFRASTGRTRTKIWCLRIASHGTAGIMDIGDGLDIFTANVFNVLDGYFEPEGAGIELWGCDVAAAFPIDTHEPDIDGVGWSDVEDARLHLEYENALRRANYIPELQRGTRFPEILRGSRTISGSVTAGDGYRMMLALAEASNTTVTAGFDVQFASMNGTEWEWDGTALLKVFRDGRYQIITL
jgi:hypothetical protein